MRIAILVALVLVQPAWAQPIRDAFDVTGRNFAGVRLPIEATDGIIAMRATTARVWTEGGRRPEGGGAPRPVQRLLLSGDVRLALGYQEFRARRAAVWLQRLDDDAGAPVYQVRAYLDRTWSSRDESLVSISASRLPVEGVIRAAEPVRVQADLVLEGREESAFLRQAELDFAQRLRRLLGVPLYTTPEGQVIDERLVETPAELQELLDSLARAEHREPIFARSGTISLDYGELTVVGSEDENAVLVSGGVTLLYEDLSRGRAIEMRAQRGVLFLEGGEITRLLQEMTPETLRGIYLEGEVLVTDGDYTLRGPRIYYDIAGDRAVVLDAVLWAFDARRGIPLYLRAEAIRQESADQFRAERATLAVSRFAEPHLSLGARTLTLTRRPQEEGEDRFFVRAQDMTLRAGGIPFFYLPMIQGDPRRIPLRRLGLDSSTGNGQALRTGWDFEALTGIRLPGGTDAEILIDGHFTRGLGLGADVSFDEPNMDGRLQTYWIINDQGEDRLHTGRELGHDGDTRGMILFHQRWAMDEAWTLWLEGNYFSDETFVDGFFEQIGWTSGEDLSGAYLQRRAGNTALALDARAQINDFSVNEFILQSPGYVTERMPEVSFVQQAIDPLGDTHPGLVTIFSEYRAGLLSINATDPTAEELGFVTSRLSQEAFGIEPGESIEDRLRRQGLSEGTVARVDMRQEVAFRSEAGGVIFNPFAVGRVTLYDDAFDEFSPDENDQARFWGSVGLRASASLVRTYDGVESDLLDLHRLRHVIEPSVTLFHASTNIERADLPVFDYGVEGLLEGSVLRIGLDQTFQTKRGGPGRRQSVDVLTIDAELVLQDDTGEPDAIGRFHNGRPELSRAGEFAALRSTVQLSDALALGGEIIQSLETSQPARMSAGLLIDHGAYNRTSIELRSINALDSTFLDLVNTQDLGDKYTFSTALTYDTDEGDFRRASVQLLRDLPGVLVGVGIVYDNVQQTTSFGFTIQPFGFRGAGLSVQGLGGVQRQSRLGG